MVVVHVASLQVWSTEVVVSGETGVEGVHVASLQVGVSVGETGVLLVVEKSSSPQ